MLRLIVVSGTPCAPAAYLHFSFVPHRVDMRRSKSDNLYGCELADYKSSASYQLARQVFKLVAALPTTQQLYVIPILLLFLVQDRSFYFCLPDWFYFVVSRQCAFASGSVATRTTRNIYQVCIWYVCPPISEVSFVSLCTSFVWLFSEVLLRSRVIGACPPVTTDPILTSYCDSYSTTLLPVVRVCTGTTTVRPQNWNGVSMFLAFRSMPLDYRPILRISFNSPVSYIVPNSAVSPQSLTAK